MNLIAFLLGIGQLLFNSAVALHGAAEESTASATETAPRASARLDELRPP